MSLTVNTTATVPTNQEMADFVLEDPGHIDIIENGISQNISRARVLQHSGDPIDNAPHRRIPAAEMRRVNVDVFRRVRAHINPSYQVNDPRIVTGNEFLLVPALTTLSGAAFVQLGLSGAFEDIPILGPLASLFGLLVLVAVPTITAYKRTNTVAEYKDFLHLIVANRNQLRDDFFYTLFHENTHAVQSRSPIVGSALGLWSSRKYLAFTEGQADDVAINLSRAVGIAEQKPALEMQALERETVRFAWVYALICRRYGCTPARDLQRVITQLRQEDKRIMTPYAIGTTAFAIARHKGILPPHREILDGNFGFIRG
jgi:hypothetical protein